MRFSESEKLHSFQALVREELDLLEAKLQEILHSDVPLVEIICRYLGSAPGKRIRPTVLFLAARSAGEMQREAVTAALAVELVHTATLVHDDIIDDHLTRRGKPTVYAKWGPDVATLTGDFLYSMAFERLAEKRMFDCMNIIARVTHVMSTGELMQVQQRRNLDLSEDRYMEMIYRKTASLFSASCECGAILGGEKNGNRGKYSGYGENMGLAFQIMDDLLDYTAVDRELGKPTASDFCDGRLTLPFIRAFRNAPDDALRRVTDLFHGEFDRRASWGEVVSFVQDHGGVEYSVERARHFGARAKGFLQDIVHTPERDALYGATDYIVERAAAAGR